MVNLGVYTQCNSRTLYMYIHLNDKKLFSIDSFCPSRVEKIFSKDTIYRFCISQVFSVIAGEP